MKSIKAGSGVDGVLWSDAVVVGSGVAGLSAALGLAEREVTLLTKANLGDGGSSRWAQGGVAAAMAADDSPREHTADTLRAGAGLCDPLVTADLLSEGPSRLRRLIALGARFDHNAAGRLRMGREGAHGRRRILHAGGDATGAEMVRTLVAGLERKPRVRVRESAFARDLVIADGRMVGVVAAHADGSVILHAAPVIILATGGFGRLYSRTTNPLAATGDGLAMAARAGALLADLALVQFHPTALATGSDPLPLVTEALRGEGAILVDAEGHRFMPGEHPGAELAPRDIVARALWRRQSRGQRIFLLPPPALAKGMRRRFPTVWRHCRNAGIDPARQPIPVTPAAHYAMAGIAVDGWGRSSIPGLWACGEVSASGLHGANRLASNSLLEALVLGARAAEAAAREGAPRPSSRQVSSAYRRVERGCGPGPTQPGAMRALRESMWSRVGLVRERQGLEEALARIEGMGGPASPDELRNLLTVGKLVCAAALAREESRGAHFRADFPEPRPELGRRSFWTYDPAARRGDFPLLARPSMGGGEERMEIA